MTDSGVVSRTEQDVSLDRAIELSDRTGDVRSRAYASSYRTRALIHECELDAAESFDEQRMTRASALGDPVLLAAAHSEAGDIALYRGELDRSQREQALCRTALEDVDPTEPSTLLGHDPGTLALGYEAWIHWLQGRPDEARRQAAASVARAESCSYPVNRAYALAFSVVIEQFRGATEAAKALAKSLAALAEEYGFAIPYPSVSAMTGWTLAQSGEIGAAIAHLREGVAASSQTRLRHGSSHLLATLAETELARGHANEGLAAIDEALAFVAETGERFWEAEIHRLNGELLLLAGEGERVEACFQTALNLARRQGALSLELRAATSLARFWEGMGRGQEARPLLAEVYGRFSEGFDTRDLRDAKSLLETL